MGINSYTYISLCIISIFVVYQWKQNTDPWDLWLCKSEFPMPRTPSSHRRTGIQGVELPKISNGIQFRIIVILQDGTWIFKGPLTRRVGVQSSKKKHGGSSIAFRMERERERERERCNLAISGRPKHRHDWHGKGTMTLKSRKRTNGKLENPTVKSKSMWSS